MAADDLPKPPRFQVPAAVAAAVAGLALTGAFAASVAQALTHGHHQTALRVAGVALTVSAYGALVASRRWPLWVWAAATAATVVQGTLGLRPTAELPALFALYLVCVGRPRRIALGVAAATLVALCARLVVSTYHAGPVSVLGVLVSSLALVGAATATGLYVGTRRAYVDALRERAERLTRERNLLAERAVAEERTRIARELHDAVAHHVTLLVVQAGAARESLPAGHPSRQMLDSMADTGRKALLEMRRTLDLLRSDPQQGAEHAPQPGVSEIADLVAQTRAAGLPVELAVEGRPRALPIGVDLSAYRIVQEALTNVVRHAGPARAKVLLRYRPDALELRVTDDGRGGPASTSGGHGLVGMRERVALFGGELTAVRVPGGGYALRALLPLVAAGTPTANGSP
ncbi:MAG TPA: sensor histidine kinase [Gaiellales bacterium]|nr:sensor histidine kinase [Gaiellales bacterium]